MDTTDVLKKVDEISHILVLTDPDAAESFAELPEKYGDLGAVLTEMGHEVAAEAARKAISVAVRTLGGEVDWQAGLEVLAETCEAIQSCLGEECAPEDAGWPVGLDGDLPAAEETPPVDASTAPAEPEPEVFTAPPAPEPAAPEEPSAGGGLVDDAIMAEFLGRQADTLDDMEEILLAADQGVSEDQMAWLLRFLHTLKGESALLGMNEVADICHASEDMLQANEITACADRLLEVKDWFVQYFRNYGNDVSGLAAPAEILANVKAPFEEMAAPAAPVAEEPAPVAPTPPPEPEPIEEAAAPAAPAAATVEAGPVSYEVVPYVGKNILEGDVDLLQDFVEEAVEHLDASENHLLTIEADPQETEALNAVFRGFHTIKGLAGFIELDHVKDLAHKAENLLDMARRGELELVGTNMDLVFESVDMMKFLVNDVAEAMSGGGTLSEAKTLSSLMARLLGATTGEAPAAAAPAPTPAPAPAAEPAPAPEPEPVAEAASEPPAAEEAPAAAPAKTSGFIPLGNMKKKAPAPAPAAEEKPVAAAPAPAAPAPAPTPTPAPPAAPQAASAEAKAKAPVKMKEAVRVDADRLDHLVETIGELVIAESMVSQSQELRDNGLSVKLVKDLDHLDKICRELQEIGMSLRMVPVRPVFQKMARLVRDLSKKTNRKVDFQMTGEDTELDKNVVDKIGDPLVHMVRNSVDHGIEPDSDDRLKAGKPERGRVELRAFHKGGNICIEIEDDGRGLDREAILQKAVSRGLVREGENLSDREIFNMIFEAGFSTAKQVTEVSGRGVGMDVVRRNIEELRGTVDISSEKGKGSIFSIKLPLTLAIIEGMVIMVGEEHYIIPTLSVVRLIRPRTEDITHVFDKGEMLAFEGNHLPLFRLGNLFDVEGAKHEPDKAMVVVVEEEGKQIGIMADQLLGQQSIVIKSLGETVQGTDGVAGGAIMSDGNVALILDIAGLVRVAHATDTTVNARMQPSSGAAATVDFDAARGLKAVPEADVTEISENDDSVIETHEEPVETGV